MCETARIQFPSGRFADEISPTEIAVVGLGAQMGTITFHPWPVRRADVDHPDELRIDLDPQPGTDYQDAVRVAGRRGGCWTSSASSGFRRPQAGAASTSTCGSSRARRSRMSATRRSRSVASSSGGVRARSTKWWKEERGEPVFVDYNQNARDRTIASAYSVRPKPGSDGVRPVSGRSSPGSSRTTSPLRPCRPASRTSATARGDRQGRLLARPLLEMLEATGHGLERHALSARLPRKCPWRAEARPAQPREEG